MTLEIQVLACDGHKDVARFNRLMEPQPSLLDNRISNGNGNDKKTLSRFASTQKDNILSQKWMTT